MFNPNASEKHLLVSGAIIIALALKVNEFRSTNLFDFVNQLASYLFMPKVKTQKCKWPSRHSKIRMTGRIRSRRAADLFSD